ncbi:MAG: hypothetical protein RL380_288 [Verrucomicrobiota bacterium]|jgi:hypothetical protein
MKTLVAFAFSLGTFVAAMFGQSSFVTDQMGGLTGPTGPTFIMQTNGVIAQSFTPNFSSLDYVQMAFFDANRSNNLGASIFVNVRADSITGQILGTSPAVALPDDFGVVGAGAGGSAGIATFYFSSSISLSPGTVYYLEPVAVGDYLAIDVYHYGYAGGTGYANGLALAGGDLWFREGILVPAPEPETLGLGLLGVGALLFARHKHIDSTPHP